MGMATGANGIRLKSISISSQFLSNMFLLAAVYDQDHLVDPQGPHPSGARCQLQWWQNFSKNWHLMMTEHSLHSAMCGFNFKPDT